MQSASPRPSRSLWRAIEDALKPSYAVAAAIVLALAGWLLSGRLGADHAQRPTDTAPPAAVAVKALPTVRVREAVATPVSREVVINGKTAPARAVELVPRRPAG